MPPFNPVSGFNNVVLGQTLFANLHENCVKAVLNKSGSPPPPRQRGIGGYTMDYSDPNTFKNFDATAPMINGYTPFGPNQQQPPPTYGNGPMPMPRYANYPSYQPPFSAMNSAAQAPSGGVYQAAYYAPGDYGSGYYGPAYHCGASHREEHEVGGTRRFRSGNGIELAVDLGDVEAVTRPSLPASPVAVVLQTRSQPSSWELEVLSRVGHSGQTTSRLSRSGGLGMISICVIDLAPWRLAVPMQSEPVSPPPMTTTCLPLALISGPATVSPATRRFCWRQELHGEVDAVEFAPGHRQVARLLRAAGQDHRVEIAQQVRRRQRRRPHAPQCGIRRLRRASAPRGVDDVLLEFEIGNAVAQQAARLSVLLEDGDGVPGTQPVAAPPPVRPAPSRQRQPACRFAAC